MILLRNEELPAKAQAQLKKYQNEIDGLPNYADKVAGAKDLFPKRKSSGKATFAVLREVLAKMCSGARRCVYCEDNAADEIEHIQPKDLYPELTFVWENYVYACGPCNGPKNNQYAVFSATTGNLTEVSRKPHDPVIAPTTGDPVFLNPRKDDALNFIALDLSGSFLLVPTASIDSRDYQRAKYTIEILRLNDRPELPVARALAYGSYRARLKEYIQEKQKGKPQPHLNSLIQDLQNLGQPTVWAEMKRQQHLIPELNALFAEAPEALHW